MKNLATFKMVYETRSFSKAAAMLFIAQPTVSAQIKQLEAEFHTQLFIRNGRGELGLTTAADELYEQVSQILAGWEELHLKLSNNHQHSRVRIAASHTFAMYLLPELLPQLYARYPAVAFSVKMANSYEVQTALLNHDADLGFIEKPLASRGLARTTLMADQLVRIGHDGPWLVREAESGVAYYTRRYLAELNNQAPVLEVASNAVIIQLLKAGFGQSIVSSRATAGLPAVPLGAAYVRSFYLLTRKAEQPLCVPTVCQWAEGKLQ